MSYKREYLDAGGIFCPFCKSDDITGGPVEVRSGSAHQEVACNACGASWQDEYTLTGFQFIETPERRHDAEEP